MSAELSRDVPDLLSNVLVVAGLVMVTFSHDSVPLFSLIDVEMLKEA